MPKLKWAPEPSNDIRVLGPADSLDKAPSPHVGFLPSEESSSICEGSGMQPVSRQKWMAWVRCAMPPNTLRVQTEYVLVKSVSPKSCGLSHERRGLENVSLPFSSIQKLRSERRGDDSCERHSRTYEHSDKLDFTIFSCYKFRFVSAGEGGSKRNRRTTAQQVANQFLAASGKHISRKTVARRLRGGGLYARRPVVCVPLTRQHRTARLQWYREHHNWIEQDWACVLFSDESRFSLSSDCRRQLIWRESGTAYRPENIQEKDRYPTCSIMVWAGIMINGRTRLHVVANGTMTGQRYIDEVLLPHVRLFRGAVGDKFVFMDDNATCHRTLAVQDCLDSEGIQRLVWPARSPDLNPIENVWDALGRQVAGRNSPPTNKNTLIRALTEEWDKLPQQLLDNVVQSMVRLVKCCITLHGGHIPY
ncbi:transposable element Tcb2 transposase [Trichonephila clavipes]|uniref:Transposable element Tcb2 transposase n=1 Tax=Trichonephila clavipes TaxID=2585209 RepID=A0A8X6RCY1_TRICX|nr:transposable element Tcb2 transposase [Trichonephila clavipes]